MKKEIVIGSRESQLAVIQSMTVVNYLKACYPEIQVKLSAMKTTGDKILDRTLEQVGGKGLFVKELDIALREKRADLTVHSLKDIPMEVPEDLPLIGFSEREDPRDVLVLPQGVNELRTDLPNGSSSLRRCLQIKKLYPESEIKPVRGNLQTRLRKLDEGQYSALILAAAGLKRSGLEYRISRYFTVDEMIPAAGQGILALQGRAGEDYSYLNQYISQTSAIIAACERAFVRTLNGGCSSPVCAFAEIQDNTVLLRGLYYDENTGSYHTGTLAGSIAEAQETGIRLAEMLSREVTSV